MKKYLILFILFLSSIILKATHLMGGEITYTCIKSGSKQGYYVFNVIIYRDCQGIPIDTNTFIKVHNHPMIDSIPLNYIGSNDISPECNTIDGSNMQFSCGSINTGYSGNGLGAVEEHIFQSDTIRVPGTPDQNGWHFTWSDCCRNGAIINIANPNNYGFTLRTAMYSYIDSNGVTMPNNDDCFDSSPSFYEKPRTILETFNGYNPLSTVNGFTYSHNAYDEELDSISYEFAPILDELGYDFLNPNSIAVPFSSPYSYLNPIGGIVIDPFTGRTFYPADLQGNYVTCTKVSSYKCGQLVSEVFREIQVVLVAPTCNLGDTTNGQLGADTLCNVRPSVQPPFYYPNLIPQYQWDTIIHCGDTVSFDFIANDFDYYPNGSRQDLLFEISGGQFYDYVNNQPCQNPPCATFQEIGTGSNPPFISSGGIGAGHFNWVTDCANMMNGCNSMRPSIYSFVIKVSDDFCPAPAIENTSQVITITVFPPCSNLKTGITTTNASCNLNDGTAISNPFGGTPPYQKYWTDVNGSAVNPQFLSSGTYILRVVDSTLCETIDTFSISGPTNILVNSVINDVSCNGFMDGSIDVSTNASNLSYSWSNGDTTEDISLLAGGSYILTIIDTFGCQLNYTFPILEPSPLIIQIDSIIDPSCYGFSDGYISVLVNGGTTPYNYLWNTGDSSVNISNLSDGTYDLLLYDANLCTDSATYSISSPPMMSNILTSSSPSCNGLFNGSVSAQVSGGLPPYEFIWNTGDTIQSLLSIPAGLYTVNIIDQNNCNILDSVLINEPDSLIAHINLDSLSVEAFASGGTAPYLYEFWSPNGFLLWVTNNTGSPVSVNTSSPGYYSFVVTDANNCTDSVSIYFGNYFDPNLDVLLSNTLCDSLSDLTITVSQDSGQVDMSTALFQSNAGSFNISALNVGDTIGTAYLMAAGGNININTMLVVSSIISSSQAIISPCSWANGCLGSFAITNSPGGGIEILSQTVPDGNNYTQGNMSSVTFENLFINPCGSLVFTSIINSELGDVDNQTIVYNISSISIVETQVFSLFPNPSEGVITLFFNNDYSFNYTIEVVNILGDIVYAKRIENIMDGNEYTIDLSSLSKGMYLLRANTDDHYFENKFILK